MVNEPKFISVKSAVEAAGAQLVAVTKQRPISAIKRMYDLGHRDFGENRVAELTDKYEALPKDINWHFIGHLQRNKVKHIAPFVYLIHSGDSPRLLREINKQAVKAGRTIPVLLQYHIAQEEAKHGFDPDRPAEMFDELDLRDLTNIQLAGVMGMATYTDDREQTGREFGSLQRIYTHLINEHLTDNPHFATISMGMSGDYQIALANGSTMVRVGSLLFN